MRNLMIRPFQFDRSLDNFFGCDPSSLFENFFDFPAGQVSRTAEFSPRVDIRENDDAISLTFEVPGMDKGDVKVLVKDNVLTVSGERKVEQEVKTDNYVRNEIRSGKFSRSFTLPDTLIEEKISADYKNGILLVTLPKAEKAKPKEINVSVD